MVMLEAWRMVEEKMVPAAFTGEGGAETGGRWNSRGVAVVYTSGTRSLAAQETLDHQSRPEIVDYRLIRIQFEEGLVERLPVEALPGDWQMDPPPPSTQRLGDDWVRSMRSAILEVPSALVPGGTNYVLNPAHPDFKKITIGKPEPVTLDPRLLA